MFQHRQVFVLIYGTVFPACKIPFFMEARIIAAVRCNKMAKCLRKIYNKDIWVKNIIFKSFHWGVS